MKIKYGKIVSIDNKLIKIMSDNKLYLAFPEHINVELTEEDLVTFISKHLFLGGRLLLIAEDIKLEKSNVLKKQ